MFLGAYNSLDVAGLILKSGRPVLVAPNELQTFKADRVVIGWKDTREARRAVTDALPLLHEAAGVTIAGICEHDDEKAVQRGINDVVQHLARHRIKAASKVILRREGLSGSQLLQVAKDERADLLVRAPMGTAGLVSGYSAG